MNKLLEILYDNLEGDDFEKTLTIKLNDEGFEGGDFEKTLTINSKDIIELCGGNWVHLKENTYWMREDIVLDVLENNNNRELRILQDPVYKNMLLDFPGRQTPTIRLNEIVGSPDCPDKVQEIFTTSLLNNNGGRHSEDKKRYIKIKDSLINEGWRTDVGMYPSLSKIVIYMFITKKQDEYVIDFMIHNGNHRIAIMDMYDLKLNVPIILKGKFYTNSKNYDLPKIKEWPDANNMMRRPLFLKVKTKKTKPVTL